jgi:hypothetical protein
MRVMVMIEANDDSEAGIMPGEDLLAAMGAYNEELLAAGVLLGGEGLTPTSEGVRVHFEGDTRTVEAGPFPRESRTIAGYWLWQVASMDDAIDWVKRCPNPMPGSSRIEIRRVFEAEDFGEEFTPELRDQEDRMRAELESRRG